MNDVIGSLLRKLRIRDDVSEAEADALRAAVGEIVRFDRRSTVVRAGERQLKSRLLIDGWVARARTLPSGERQITEVHVPGDFVDLHSFLLKRLDHDVIALTPCTIANVDHEDLARLTEQQPHLTRMLWLSTTIDAAMHREWIAQMGRSSALQRLAHLFCELYVRLEGVGLGTDECFDLPLTQDELADACGLTSVHVNRVLQEMRGDGLIITSGRQLRIPDWDRLAKAGQFDPTYLNLWKEPR